MNELQIEAGRHGGFVVIASSRTTGTRDGLLFAGDAAAVLDFVSTIINSATFDPIETGQASKARGAT